MSYRQGHEKSFLKYFFKIILNQAVQNCVERMDIVMHNWIQNP